MSTVLRLVDFVADLPIVVRGGIGLGLLVGVRPAYAWLYTSFPAATPSAALAASAFTFFLWSLTLLWLVGAYRDLKAAREGRLRDRL